MGNVIVTVNPDNPWIITIDASTTTEEQRELLGETINYTEGPMLAMVIADAMRKRAKHMEAIWEEKRLASGAEEKAAIFGTFMS